jgi:hypothetical protein
LQHAVAAKDLTYRLLSAGVDEQQFIAELARQCGGVWVYLRYVLDEVSLGIRRADEVKSLPQELNAYYSMNIARLEAGSGPWMALLAIMAVVREPMTVTALADLAGVGKLSDVERFCRTLFRPFLARSVDYGRGLNRYVIYHDSLREFVCHGHFRGHGNALSTLMVELSGATLVAHSKVADRYLTAFGGLGAGLPLLARKVDVAGIDDGYAVRNLAFHLHEANRLDDLCALLTCRTANEGNGRGRLIWQMTHDQNETLSLYLNDVGLAAQHAAIYTDREIEKR